MKIFHSNFLIKYFIILLLAVGGSFFIPPTQSPDENQHIARAWLISQGEILLTNPAGRMSGGHVDDGLHDFIQGHMQLSGRPDFKLSEEEKIRLKQIAWSDSKSRSFMEIPGTGFYLPLIYLPHAIAIKAGELANMSIHQTYYLMRIFIMAISIALMLFAFSLYRPGILVLSIIMLPMSIFQLLSPTLDGITTSLTLVIVSLFFTFRSRPPGTFYLLTFLVILIATTRIHLAPLLLLLFVLAWQEKNRKMLGISLLATCLTISWIIFSIKITVDNRIPRDITSLETLQYYLFHPANFLKVIANTITNEEMLFFYFQSFIGRLGWLDTTLSGWHYTALLSFLVPFFIINALSEPEKDNNVTARIALAGTSFFAILAIFTALLISWTPHPAMIVQGIQGRYFTVPLLLLAYALHGIAGLRFRAPPIAAQLLLSLFFIFSAYSLLTALQDRYHLFSP